MGMMKTITQNFTRPRGRQKGVRCEWGGDRFWTYFYCLSMIFPWYFHDISMIFPWYFHFMISFLSFLSQNTHGFSMKYPQLRHGQNRGISWWSPGYWRTKTIPVLQGEDLEKMRQARRKREGKAREQNGEGNRLVTWKYSYGTLEDTGRF